MAEDDGDARRSQLRRLTHKERRLEWEQRHLVKDRSADSAVLEEVFDKSTLMTIYQLMNGGVIDKLYGAVKSGKEAKIYRGTNPKGEELAIKIYLTVSAEFKKGMIPYLEGDIRFRHVKHDTRSLIYAWALKEFKNLKTTYEVGVPVPKPHIVMRNVLVMEFIGKNGVQAPLIRDAEVSRPAEVYEKLLKFVKLLYKKGKLVHGDLSEYNIMLRNGRPVIFDMSQSVPTSHPMADHLLRRDTSNLNSFFQRKDVKVRPTDEIYKWITEDG